MSFAALLWASKVSGVRPAEKLVLLGMAECAGRDDGRAFPSIAALVEFSGLNRKTVIGALSALVERGFISETGETVGQTSQIKVYRLHVETVPETGLYNSGNSTTFGRKESQKRDTEPVINPIPSEDKSSSGKRAPKITQDFPRPEWADPDVWVDFLKNRKAKRLRNTPTAHKGFLEDIARIATDEWPPGRLLLHATRKGWGAIYEPEEMKNGRNRQHSSASAGRIDPFQAALREVAGNSPDTGGTDYGGGMQRARSVGRAAIGH